MAGGILIANRGEIALRIMRTCRTLGLRTVAVFVEDDAEAPHVGFADDAVDIGPGGYLAPGRLIEAAQRLDCAMIHPGYGFLSENAAFARAVTQAGLIFIGPSAETIAAVGDKIEARRRAVSLGIPVIPGCEPSTSPEALLDGARSLTLPLLVKAAGGGGGRGMRRVTRYDDLGQALAAASREAESAFGDPRVYVESAIDGARHVEIQIVGERDGRVLHFHERDCSLQRRHQKIIEEAPAPGLSPHVREGLARDAIRLAEAVRYEGAGSVEFLVRDEEWFFLEVNARLQVEHPVTELILGIDLVMAQLLVASGGRMPWLQDDLQPRGHAIEARLCAEDAGRGFVPCPGRIERLQFPSGPGVRVDAGVVAGGTVSPDYDSMIAKIIAYGANRDEALARLGCALEETVVLGVETTGGFLRDLLDDPRFREGRPHIGLAAARAAGWTPSQVKPQLFQAAAAAAALALAGERRAVRVSVGEQVDSPWQHLAGWRLGAGE